jgi:hypothetical protein
VQKANIISRYMDELDEIQRERNQKLFNQGSFGENTDRSSIQSGADQE